MNNFVAANRQVSFASAPIIYGMFTSDLKTSAEIDNKLEATHEAALKCSFLFNSVFEIECDVGKARTSFRMLESNERATMDLDRAFLIRLCA